MKLSMGFWTHARSWTEGIFGLYKGVFLNFSQMNLANMFYFYL